MCVRDDGMQVVAKVSWPREACIRSGGGEGGGKKLRSSLQLSIMSQRPGLPVSALGHHH